MKFIAIILVAFSLSGCIWQSVDQYDLQDAIRACGAVEKIAYVSANFMGVEGATCMDNHKIILHNND